MTPSVSLLAVTPPAGVNLASNHMTNVYDDLRRIAARHLGCERRNHTLQPTALVHEAYLKLASGDRNGFADHVHFLAVASRAMRQILVDYARSRATQKRKVLSSIEPVEVETLEVSGDHGPEFIELLALDAALDALAAENQRVARAVEMRFFGGMTAEETADALGMSVHVVRHDLRFAQAWLRRRMRS